MALNRHCPIIGCDRTRKRGDAMCAEHWDMVPAELRSAVTAWADMPFSRGHVACLQRAIDAVNRRIDEALNLARNRTLKLTVTVRYTAGTYIARGGGKTASCTSGRDRAVIALARKVFPGRDDFAMRIVRHEDVDAGELASVWEITLPETEPHHAA